MERFTAIMEKEAQLLSINPGSVLLTKEKFDMIVKHLKQPEKTTDAHFRHWVKKKRFSLMNMPGIGLVDVLVVPNVKGKDAGSASYLRVLHADNAVSVLLEIHATELKHSGYKKVLDFSQRHYQGTTRGFVQKFCSQCPTCQLSAPQITRPPLKPMVEKDFLERVQIDLIDMRHSPDGDYHYIAHFSKFHILFPLKTKSALEVARLLEERVLAYLGPPKIFHSDNGREFVNQVMRALFESWGGQVTFVNGRPRHSQSQGLVERGNRTVEQKLAAMKVDEGCDSNNTYPWASWLPRIMFSLNTEVQRTTNEPPYKVVFGKSPPTGLFPGADPIVEEEDLDESHQPLNLPIPTPRKKLRLELERNVTKEPDQPSQLSETEPPTQLSEAETEPTTQLSEAETKPTTQLSEAETEPSTQLSEAFNVQTGSFIQIFYTHNHWITIARNDNKQIRIYDSLRQLPAKNIIESVAKYILSDDDVIEFALMNNQQQGSLPDCGAFAVAFATSLLCGEDPTQLEYDECEVRQHLRRCIETQNFVAFPSRPKFRSSTVVSSSTLEIYCVCRCPDDGNLMLECEECNLWFHAKCVGLKTQRQRKEAANSWLCSRCLCSRKQ